MEDLLKASLDYIRYSTTQEPRIKQNYPEVQDSDFRKQEQAPHMMPMVEEVFDLINFDSLDECFR